MKLEQNEFYWIVCFSNCAFLIVLQNIFAAYAIFLRCWYAISILELNGWFMSPWGYMSNVCLLPTYVTFLWLMWSLYCKLPLVRIEELIGITELSVFQIVHSTEMCFSQKCTTFFRIALIECFAKYAHSLPPCVTFLWSMWSLYFQVPQGRECFKILTSSFQCSWQNIGFIKITVYWIQTTDLWCLNRLLCRLSHNHAQTRERVEAQLVEQSLPIPEVHGLNPVIGKNLYLYWTFVYWQLCIEKAKMAHFFKKKLGREWGVYWYSIVSVFDHQWSQ